MHTHLRWSGLLAVLLLAVTACGRDASPSAVAGASAGASQDIAAVCEADPFGCVEIAAGDPIRLASALAIVGDVAYLGIDSNIGIEVAIDDRGQILGHDVELVKVDAGCDQAVDGESAAQAIVADPQIAGVIGTSCSPTTVPAMRVLADAGLVMISPSSTSPSLTNPEMPDFGGPSYFRTAYNDLVQGTAVARFACEELDGIDTAATIYDGSADAEQLQQIFVDRFEADCGGTVTAQERISVGAQDFSTVLSTIGSDSPDLLFFPISSAEGSLVVSQSQDVAGLADTILVGADRMKDGAFATAAGDLAEEVGMYFAGPDLDFGTPYTQGFLPTYLAKSGTGDPLAQYHTYAYDAANIFFDAILAVGMRDLDGTLWVPREAIREFVTNLVDFPGLTGTLTCADNGDCGSEFVSLAQLVDGVYTEVYTTRP
jgi:branched-chain amino acid transport system substrate-binding protein